jgi:hypothetical protein
MPQDWNYGRPARLCKHEQSEGVWRILSVIAPITLKTGLPSFHSNLTCPQSSVFDPGSGSKLPGSESGIYHELRNTDFWAGRVLASLNT